MFEVHGGCPSCRSELSKITFDVKAGIRKPISIMPSDICWMMRNWDGREEKMKDGKEDGDDISLQSATCSRDPATRTNN